MHRRLHTRLLSALVAALLLGGAGGAADLDALLFHGAAAGTAAASPHFEAARAAHHADQCLVALRLASGAGAAPSVVPTRAVASPSRAAPRRPVAAPDRFYPGLHQDSRAPPSVLA